MSHAFLSSADKIQCFSAVLSDIYSRSDLWFLRLGIKKAMKIWYSILLDYGLLTGFSIVTVHHGPERIHSGLLNILPLFPCRMYPMNHEALRPWDWHLHTQNRISSTLSANIGSFFMQELTESQLYNNYTIRYYYITHSSGVSLQLTKEENITSQNQLFFSKMGKLLINDMFSNKKNWLRSVYSPLARLNSRKCCICKINICHA